MNTIKTKKVLTLITLLTFLGVSLLTTANYIDNTQKLLYNNNIRLENNLIELGGNTDMAKKSKKNALGKKIKKIKPIIAEPIVTKVAEVLDVPVVPETPPVINVATIEIENVNRGTVETRSSNPYTEEDLYLLAKLVHCEAGAEWLEDEHQQLVAMVALNRVKSEHFPNTLKEVVYQPGQYACVKIDWYWAEEPSQRDIDNARLALEGKVECPSNVVFQAEFKQGSGIYKSFLDSVTGKTTYFCYY